MGNLENKKDGLVGKAKEAYGEATDNQDVANEGKADQVKSEIKQGIEELGDKVKEAGDKILGAFQNDKK